MSKRKRQPELLAKRRSKRQKTKAVDTVNALHAEDFFTRYVTQDQAFLDFQRHCGLLEPSMQVTLRSPGSEDQGFLEQCFGLVEQSSAHDYRGSEMRWSPTKKKREMRLPDLRYVVLCNGRAVDGFASFMATYEDGIEVLYVYEIHLGPRLRGLGLGRMLMRVMERVGCNVGVEKLMLTVFKANTAAVAFYARLGYVQDAFSPEPKLLRNGTGKEFSYVILSKPLDQNGRAGDGGGAV